MSIINRLFGFSTKDVCLVEILTFYERKMIDFHTSKIYYKPNMQFRVVREKTDANGTYYKDLVSRRKYKDVFNSNNYVGDIVATKKLDLDKKRRLKYKDARIFNDSINKDNYHDLDNIVMLKKS